MRLLWLIDSLTVGGAESLLIPLARRIDRGAYDLRICCLTTIEGNAVEQELRKEGVSITNLGARNLRDVRAFRGLLRLLREERIELMHAHLTYASIWGALASRITGVPVVATLHVAPPQEGRASIRDRIMRFALDRWSAGVIAVSDALRRRYLGGGGIDAKKLMVVHNGIEVERFRGDADEARATLMRELDIPPAAKIVVTVSVLRPGKGIEVLLDAIPHIVRAVPDACFVIVGDGPMRGAWSERARELGVERHVRWAGYRNDVAAILPGCDLFVLPSLDDAFPTVLMEALAAGVPLVATEVGGIPEIVTPGLTGTLVPAGDAMRLAEEVAEMLADEETLRRMRGAARDAASQRFSTGAWLQRLDQVYARCAR